MKKFKMSKEKATQIYISISMLLTKYFILYFVGGTIYLGIELLWRGYSNISMFFLGGIVFILIGLLNEWFSWETPLWKQMLASSFIITSLELITGMIVNVWLGWNVWDYSDMLLNLFYGQICLPFMALWFVLSFVAIVFDDYLRYWWFGEEKPHYKF